MKSDIQKYYDRCFKTEGMPAFDQLTAEQVSEFENTLGFAAWNAGRAINALKLSIIQSFSKRRPYHRRISAI